VKKAGSQASARPIMLGRRRSAARKLTRGAKKAYGQVDRCPLELRYHGAQGSE